MDVFLPRERGTMNSRGFGFVTFVDRRDAEDAEEMNGRDYMGRALKVNMARERPPIEESRTRYDENRSRWERQRGGYRDDRRDRDRDRYDDRRDDRRDRGYDRRDDRGYDRRRSRSRSRSRSPRRYY